MSELEPTPELPGRCARCKRRVDHKANYRKARRAGTEAPRDRRVESIVPGPSPLNDLLAPRGSAPGACFRKRYNLPMLLPLSNSIFCSYFGAAYFNLRPIRAGLSFAPLGRGAFYNTKFFEPGGRRAKMPAAFCG